MDKGLDEAKTLVKAAIANYMEGTL
jgi:hypothetical protein